MAKTKQQKEQVVAELKEKLSSAKSVIIANQEGLTVNDSQELRQNCKNENVEFLAVKKTLLKLVLKEVGIEDVDVKAMKGGLAVAISLDDEVAPARILKEFAKDHEQVEFQGGIVEGAVVGVDQVEALASMPSKLELYAKVVGSLKSPVSGFVNVLRGNLSGLINVLNAIKESK